MQPHRKVTWRAFPALLAAACFSGGVVLARYGTGVQWGWWGFSFAGAALLLAGIACQPQRKLVSLFPLGRVLAVGLLFVTAGGLRWVDFYVRPQDNVGHLVQDRNERRVELRGRVRGVPEWSAHGLRFRLAVRIVVSKADTMRASGLVKVTAWRRENAPLPVLREAEAVRVRGWLRPVPAPRNPADFDYGAYLRRQGIFAVLTVADEPGGLAVEQARAAGLLERTTRRLRRYVRRHVRHLVPTPEGRHVVLALVLGERYHLKQATEDRFARHGLMHLLAVSGLHVLLVGLVLYYLLRSFLLRLGVSRRWAEVGRTAVTLAVLAAYALVTGGAASVVRATLMTAFWMGAVLLQRRAYTMNLLGASALVLLWARPPQLFEVGFQLSFAAVAALALFTPRFKEWVPECCFRSEPVSYVSNLIVASAAATLGTLPVLLFHFGRVSFAGLVLNVVAIPATMLSLGSTLVALLTALALPAVSVAFGSAADVFARLLLWTARLGDAVFSWAAIHAHVTSIWSLGAMGALLVMLAQWARPRWRWRAGLAALLLATTGMSVEVLNGSVRPRLEVVFFDVGHGDAALLMLPNDRHVLIDTGPRTRFTNRGARVIKAHLRRYGIHRLDAIVVTHSHSDHLGGVPDLLRSVPVGRLVYNGRPHSSALYAETMHLADSLDVPRRAAAAGDTLLCDPAVRMQVLGPDRNTAPDNANEASVVLRVAYGETDFLFTGDIERGSERRLVQRYGSLLASDVVKVPHHGSITSSSLAFVRATTDTKTRAVVSVSRSGRFGLPDGKALRRWRRNGARLRTTATGGAVWLRSDGRRVWRVGWR